MRAGGFVSDSLDGSVGYQVSDEFELGGAGLAVPARNWPDGAAVQVDPEVVVINLVEVGEVSLFIEQLGQDADAFVDRFALQFALGVVDESASTTVEDSVDESGVFLFSVAENLDRQIGGGRVEQWLGELGGVVAIGGASGLSALLASCDEAGGSERAQMLSDGARGDPQRRGQLIGGCLATSLQCPEHAPLRGRRCDVGRVHSTKATTGSQVYERYAR